MGTIGAAFLPPLILFGIGCAGFSMYLQHSAYASATLRNPLPNQAYSPSWSTLELFVFDPPVPESAGRDYVRSLFVAAAGFTSGTVAALILGKPPGVLFLGFLSALGWIAATRALILMRKARRSS